MDFISAIEAFHPANEQEWKDKQVIQDYIKHFGKNILLRDNKIAHITSSGFVMNETLDNVLLVHHNIREVWSWTGGHADGDEDLLYVALKEAREETGVRDIRPFTDCIASIDILPVFGHYKNMNYVNTHLHLSIAYILIADEANELHICSEENSGVEWFSIDKFTTDHFDQRDVYLYNKLITYAHKINSSNNNNNNNNNIK